MSAFWALRWQGACLDGPCFVPRNHSPPIWGWRHAPVPEITIGMREAADSVNQKAHFGIGSTGSRRYDGQSDRPFSAPNSFNLHRKTTRDPLRRAPQRHAVRDEGAGRSRRRSRRCRVSKTPNLDTAQAVLEESAKLCGEVLAPLNVEGDRNPSSWKDGVVTATPGFADAFRQFGEGGWQGVQHPVDYEGQGLAEADRDTLHGNAERVEPLLRAVSAVDRRRNRSAADCRYRSAKADLCAEADLRRVDRHDEPDRAASRLRSRARAHTCRTAGRRLVQGVRHEDFHHVGRARHGEEHRPSRAGAHAERTRRREGHFALHRAEVSRQ